MRKSETLAKNRDKRVPLIFTVTAVLSVVAILGLIATLTGILTNVPILVWSGAVSIGLLILWSWLVVAWIMYQIYKENKNAWS